MSESTFRDLSVMTTIKIMTDQHEAAAERLGMRRHRLNTNPHVLIRNGFTDGCIAGADCTEALHMLLS